MHQIYAYHELNNDSSSVFLEVVKDGDSKPWAMFAGYNDLK